MADFNIIIRDVPAVTAPTPCMLHILFPFRRRARGGIQIYTNLIGKPECLWYLTGETPDSLNQVINELHPNGVNVNHEGILMVFI